MIDILHFHGKPEHMKRFAKDATKYLKNPMEESVNCAIAG
jgi:quinol monooxygenase YgiN